MNVAALVVAVMVFEAAAIIAWPMRHPVAALVVLATYAVLQVALAVPTNQRPGWPPSRRRNDDKKS